MAKIEQATTTAPTPTVTLESLQAIVEAQSRMIADLQAQTSTSSMQQKLDGAPQSALPRPVVEQFLADAAPVDEFYAMPYQGGDGRYRRVCLFLETRNDKGQVTKPDLWLDFTPWGGPGSDLIDDYSKKPSNFGFIRLSDLPLVTITQADIDLYGLKCRPQTGKYTLDEVLKRIEECRDFVSGIVVDSKRFRDMMRIRYAHTWQIQADTQKVQAILASGAQERVKLGRLTA